MWEYNYTDELYHHGVKGMKWGVRRYQNADGSMTAAGKKRYSDKSAYEVKTADGDTFRIHGGSSKNYNTKNSKVTKTYGEHLYEVDNKKLQKKQQKKLEKQQKKWDRNVNNNWTGAYNRAADTINSKLDKFNSKYEGIDTSDPKSPATKKYVKEYCDMWNSVYTKELESTFGKAPIETGKAWVERVPMFINENDLLKQF